MAELIISITKKYVERSKGPLSRVSFDTRLSILLFISVAAIVFDRVSILTALAITSTTLFALCKPNLRKVIAVAVFTLATVWSIVFSQGLFYQGTPRTVITELVPSSTPIIGWLTGGIYLYYEGLTYGLKQSIRAIATILMGAAVVSSTSSTEVYQLLSKHPRILITVLVALRGIEKLLNELMDALAMIKLSGEKVGYTKLLGFIPLISRRIEEVSISAALIMDYANPKVGRGGTHVTSLAIVLATLALAILYIITKAYVAGVLWNPLIERIYELTRLWFSGS